MRGHVRERGKDSWEVIVSLGKGPDGKYHQTRRTVHGGKTEAEAALAEMLVAANSGQVSITKDTLGEYLLQWMDDYVKANLDILTAKSYEMVIRQHIIPAMAMYR